MDAGEGDSKRRPLLQTGAHQSLSYPLVIHLRKLVVRIYQVGLEHAVCGRHRVENVIAVYPHILRVILNANSYVTH